MSEFPKNPNKRQRREQNEIANIVGSLGVQLDIDFVQAPQLPSTDSGYDWDKYLEYYMGKYDK